MGYCGNSKKEKGEDCDGGELMSKGLDKCCNVHCKLTKTAMCRLVVVSGGVGQERVIN